MKTDFQQRCHRQRGMTIAETLVAVLVFSVVFVAALGLYQAANRAYISTDAATIQQQNVRFAMDRLLYTLKNAGASYNVTGATTIPDEQVEGAWEAAVFVRGDYDNARVTALENTSHPYVTVGNNEIVGYVLRKPGGDANNASTITVKTDLTPSTGRDGAISGTTITGEETATIHVAAVALADETNPPYQLTRVTFDSSGNPVYDVIADNIFRMSFAYFTSDGVTTMTTTGGADGTSLADRNARATVRSIDVNLIGMTDRPDLGYKDTNTYSPAEGSSTKAYRKFTLAEHIVAPNLGLIGKRHYTVPSITIAAPATITACTGHCRYFHLSWPASTTGGVTYYRVYITAPAGTNPAISTYKDVGSLQYDYEQPDSESRAYTFSVAGETSDSSIIGTASSTVSATATNDATQSIPQAPTNVAASQATGVYAMSLYWDAVTQNTGTLTASTCTTSDGSTSAPTSPWNTKAIDLGTYQVYRVRSSGNTASFTTATTNRVDNQTIGSLANTTPTSNGFIDNTAAPCTTYYYKVKACDLCGINSSDSLPMSASASYDLTDTTVVPGTPSSLTGSSSTSGGNYNVTLNWTAVTATSTGVAAATTHYRVTRYKKVSPATTWSSDTTFDLYEAYTMTDSVPTTSGGQTVLYQYTVRAIYDCSSPRLGTESAAYSVGCSALGTITITTPAASSQIQRPYESTLTPAASITSTGWTSLTATITNAGGTSVYSQTLSTPVTGSNSFPAWDSSALADGTYTMTVSGIENGCTPTPASVSFSLVTGTCSLVIPSGAQFHGSGANADTSLTFTIQNTCTNSDEGITFNKLKFTFSGVPASVYISKIQNGSGTTLATPASTATGGTGVTITLSTAQIIAANTTTGSWTISFSTNFTSDGTKNGTPGSFTSVLASETAPVVTTDELVGGTSVP